MNAYYALLLFAVTLLLTQITSKFSIEINDIWGLLAQFFVFLSGSSLYLMAEAANRQIRREQIQEKTEYYQNLIARA